MGQYNTAQYNTQQYNSALWHEYLFLTETMVASASLPLPEVIFFSDVVVPSISNLGLMETMKFNDWAEIRRPSPQSDWGN